MLIYDPRSISMKVYQNLTELKNNTPDTAQQKEQRTQIFELYSYVATWGLLRLKAEEVALNQESKQEVVKCFFKTLEQVAYPEKQTTQEQQPTQQQQPITNQQSTLRRPNSPIRPNSSNQTTEESSETKISIAYLTNPAKTADYLGLTGLALQVAREFAFWVDAIYPETKGK
ncbi:MAG: hypothetical protein WBA77_00745 [Microcoleaceae cyanobacterium]